MTDAAQLTLEYASGYRTVCQVLGTQDEPEGHNPTPAPIEDVVQEIRRLQARDTELTEQEVSARELEEAKSTSDALHPRGRCTCGGEGQCTWCLLIEAEMRAEQAESVAADKIANLVVQRLRPDARYVLGVDYTVVPEAKWRKGKRRGVWELHQARPHLGGDPRFVAAVWKTTSPFGLIWVWWAHEPNLTHNIRDGWSHSFQIAKDKAYDVVMGKKVTNG